MPRTAHIESLEEIKQLKVRLDTILSFVSP